MKRIPSLLLAAVLLLSSGCSLRTTEKTPPTQAPVQTAVPISTPEHTSGPTPVPTPEPCEFTGYRRGEYHLDDISYTPPDYEAFRAEIERIRAMLADGTDSETILEAYEALEEARDSITSADSLVSLYSAMDVNDSYYTEQSEWIAARSSELTSLCTQLDIEIENSPHRDAVFYDWTEEDFRRLRIAEKLYDDDYAALNTRLDELVNDYYAAMANTTFTYDGQEYAQAELETLEVDPDLYYTLLNDCYRSINAEVGPLYLELIDIEKQIAAKAGYDSFPAFSYDYQYGRDYTPEDSRALWASVKRYAVPLIRALYSSFTQEEYSGLMLAYNARDQLSEHKRCLDAYASTISPLMQEAYNYLEEYGLGIIGTSDTSQDGAFTGYLSDYDAPFLYLREQGGYMDILNLLHEFGHFFSAYLGGQDTLLCMSPDVAEICSQANELLFLPTFGEYYPSDTYNGILKQKMIDVLYIVVNACLYDEFQQYVYEHELSTVEELNDAFLAISTDYGMGQGYYIMDARYVWVTMRHNFQFPMYHISYGASIIPAMQIFDISLRDREQAIHIYLQVVESDPTLTFSQVLEQVGLSSPFEEQTIVDIINAVADAVDLNYEVSVPAA